ncbi:peptidylprolyl isomerase [Dellaglioa sp. P0083]|uniref:peptidylprolyl isomerase n=1 Tax=Dellaglioa kimchii TaxID=3344667 RepID=UPI0038D4986A
MTYPQLDLEHVVGPKVKMITNYGDITIQLFPEQAPKTVENFIGLSGKGYYKDVIFHRVISDFMVQSGDPTGSGMGGESIWGKSFADEFSSELFNLRGALSMANSGPSTNGSQFFIVQNSNVPEQMIGQLKDANYPEEVVEEYKKGGTPWLDFHHTVFGQVVSGMDIVDKIAGAKTAMQDKPVEPIVIEDMIVTK